MSPSQLPVVQAFVAVCPGHPKGRMVPGLTEIPANLEAISAAEVTLRLVYGPRRNLSIAKELRGTLDSQIGCTGFATVEDASLVRWRPSDDVADRDPC